MIQLTFCVHSFRIVLIVFCCSACSPPAPNQDDLLHVLLGDRQAEGFKQALQKRTFIFPQDHGPHPEYKNEWWYLTGNLKDEAGRQFGYQVTFFRFALGKRIQKKSEVTSF